MYGNNAFEGVMAHLSCPAYIIVVKTAGYVTFIPKTLSNFLS